ncbi:MAG TPA: glycosyltransferase family 2 protein [Acetobacteraceae bacterium]|nr:glycosyltransferase family 2 protein [Acetobacteraceae bacterium]
MSEAPRVSVIVPTCNRAEALFRALARIKAQSFGDFECLVVDDGSEAAVQAQYAAGWGALDERFVLCLRDKTERRGGNPARTRNRGIRRARGTYLAFCDDDDLWVRDDHLEVAVAAMTRCDADLFFADLQFSDEGQVVRASWYEAVQPVLRRHPLEPGGDLFTLPKPELCKMLSQRHLHVDVTVVSRALMLEVGMFWEHAQFNEDLEVSLRLAARARRVVHRATPTAALDVSFHPSAIRRFTDQERALDDVMACLRAETEIDDPALRRVARSLRAWRLLDLADFARAAGARRQMRELGLQALLLFPTLRAVKTLAGAGLARRPAAGESPAPG